MGPFDYLIVGAGPAGCVLANRLSADPGVRVGLIEAGPDGNQKKHIIRTPLAMVTFMAPSLAFLGGPRFMDWFSTEPEPGLQGRAIALPRGIGVGGSSNVNGQIFIRGQREDFDGWKALGCAGWGYDDLLPYFRKLERFEPLAEPDSLRHLRPQARKNIDPAFHGTDGALNIAALRSVNRLCEDYLDAAEAAGLKLNPDFNGATQEGAGYYTFTQRHGQRVTAEGAYIDPIRNRDNLTILSGRRVSRLDRDGTTIKGVVLADGTRIAARETILSAGAFGSPHLLMLSGIGPGAQLRRNGVEVAVDLPDVGRNLQDHLDVTLEYRAATRQPYGISWPALPRNALHVADWLVRRRGLFASTTGEGGAFVRSRPDVERPDLQLFFCTARGNTQNAGGFTGHGFLMHVCELRPGSVGRVELAGPEAERKPSILYNFFRGDSDMRPLRDGIRLARRIIDQPMLKRHVAEEVDPGPEAQSDGALDAFIREKVGTLFHPVGTCAMGPDKVVDPRDMRVHGTSGLRVVDASIMPRIVSGNTVAATYCLAERAADLIAGADAGMARDAA